MMSAGAGVAIGNEAEVTITAFEDAEIVLVDTAP
jgi:hypothetical protein